MKKGEERYSDSDVPVVNCTFSYLCIFYSHESLTTSDTTVGPAGPLAVLGARVIAARFHFIGSVDQACSGSAATTANCTGSPLT